MKYFISDLHLSEAEPTLTELFYRFLAEHAPQMQALYILGDFFDAWIGDDDDRPLAQNIAAALQQLANTGKQIFFMHGNRDFLLGSAFAERCGMALLPEISRLDAGIVLCHGDHLCTQDLAYQSFRAQVRNPQWQAQFLAQPLAARRAFAAQARAQSQAHQKEIMATIADVDSDAVIELHHAHPARTVIHGHTHRPGVHQTIHGQRIVLGDWRDGEPSWLSLDGSTRVLVAHGQSWFFSVSATTLRLPVKLSFKPFEALAIRKIDERGV